MLVATAPSGEMGLPHRRSFATNWGHAQTQALPGVDELSLLLNSHERPLSLVALPLCRERPLERLADLYTGLLHGADLSPSDEAVSVVLLSAMQRKWRNALVKKRLEEWRRSKVRFAAFFHIGGCKEF